MNGYPAVYARAIAVRGITAIVCLACLASSASGHAFGDDYGDSSTAAYPLALNSTNAGRIEIDTDQDWFNFAMEPRRMMGVRSTSSAPRQVDSTQHSAQ